MLTDEQCDYYRRLPVSFNDMLRAVYKDGAKAGFYSGFSAGIEVTGEGYNGEIGNVDYAKADAAWDRFVKEVEL